MSLSSPDKSCSKNKKVVKRRPKLVSSLLFCVKRVEEVDGGVDDLALLIFTRDGRFPVARLYTIPAELRVISAFDNHPFWISRKQRFPALDGLMIDIEGAINR
jgi:hypothetical protein